MRIPLAQTARWNGDANADREATLGHRDHLARVTRHLCSSFVLKTVHYRFAVSSRWGLPGTSFRHVRPSTITEGCLLSLKSRAFRPPARQ
jgi:hypothetical protein